jgi:hypothetical protein
MPHSPATNCLYAALSESRRRTRTPDHFITGGSPAGRAQPEVGQRLGSGATAGEGIQNLMCAAQAAAALIALVGASAGISVIDPMAALVVAAIAATGSVKLWRGAQDECRAPIGFAGPTADDCCNTGDSILVGLRAGGRHLSTSGA